MEELIGLGGNRFAKTEFLYYQCESVVQLKKDCTYSLKCDHQNDSDIFHWSFTSDYFWFC